MLSSCLALKSLISCCTFINNAWLHTSTYLLCWAMNCSTCFPTSVILRCCVLLCCCCDDCNEIICCFIWLCCVSSCCCPCAFKACSSVACVLLISISFSILL